MKKPVILVMAAGMGSRYGGLKQMDPVGPGGAAILDYSLYDAKRAGFEKAVLVINRRIEKDFRELVGRRIENRMDVEYAFQELDKLPEGFSVPEGRTKPWGTSHAVLCGKDAVGDSPFAAVNADDYYGIESFAAMHDFLIRQQGTGRYAMVGYELRNTLTENGAVSRGECRVSGEGLLQSVTERTRIEAGNGAPFYEENGEKVLLDPKTTVSMNFWGFTPDFFGELETRFPLFLRQALANDPQKGEFYLPFAVDELVREGKAAVEVLRCGAKWYGVTYREDRPTVVEALARMTKEGLYPEGM